jgi:hypothetical protein
MAKWQNFPFQVDGINFNSRVDMESYIGERVALVPEQVFVQMNIGAIRSCIGNLTTMTREEIISELARVNEGASSAIVELV